MPEMNAVQLALAKCSLPASDPPPQNPHTLRPPTPMTPLIQARDIRQAYRGTAGHETLAIHGVSLDIRAGEFVALVGPSGSGKSTLLQIVAGLVEPTAGRVELHGKRVDGPPPEMVYLFQQYAKSLLPWRTVEENVALPLENRRELTSQERRARSRHYLQQVGLERFASHHPWQLSGGMQQRVAIARALAAEARILLLDEPFSAVDALTRLDLQKLVLELWRSQQLTIVMVTHDVEEAVFMADRIVLLSPPPARIDLVLEPDLPRPRDLIGTREQAAFLRARHQLLERLLQRAPAEVAHA